MPTDESTTTPDESSPAEAPEGRPASVQDITPTEITPVEVRNTDATPTDATPTAEQQSSADASAETASEPSAQPAGDPSAPAPVQNADGTTTEGPAKKKRRRRRKRGKKPGDAANATGATPEGAATEGAEGESDGDDGEEDGDTPAEGGEAKPEGAAADGATPAAKGGEGDKKKKDKAKKPQKDRGPAREKPPFGTGEEVVGKITKVMDEALMIDVSGKALGIFDRKEAPESEVFTEGERFIGKVSNDGARGGLVVLTRDLNRWQLARTEVEEAFKNKTPVDGLITGVIKGGVEVDVKGLRGFAPASHVDLRLGADLHYLIGQRMPFEIVQFAKRGREFVLSRKGYLEETAKATRAEALEKLEIGKIVKGVVRSITQFGAFVDVGGIDGLVHVTEASHSGKPLHEVFKVNQETEVKILRVDEKGKVWLSRRAAEHDPWEGAAERYAKGTTHKGKIVRLQPFGAFIELEPGIDGLMHVSDIPSPTKRFHHPNEVLKVGEEMDVIVAQSNIEARKIGLHAAPKEGEEVAPQQDEQPREPRPRPAPRLAPHQAVKVIVEAQEPNGLVVKIVGQTGRNEKGYIAAMATGTPKGTDLRKAFPVGKELDAKVVETGPRGTKLSITALAKDQERQSFRQYQNQVKQAAKFGTFGDLLMKKGLNK
jgi:small subunit ribosomal protein S1